MRSGTRLPTVKVIREGFLVREEGRIVDASSTVSVVESSDARIVVDTGSPRDSDLLVSLFRKAGIPLEVVGIVVNTHLHIDHIGCNELFENARFVAHELEEPPAGTIRIKGPTEIAPGVRIVPTPGHTRGSVSLFVSGERKWALCGDAVPIEENCKKHVPPLINVDPRLALDSLDSIVAWADEIVPGHGPPFSVLGKKYDA